MNSKTNVLLVDDDLTVRQSLQQVLMLEDFHVVTAANGRDAICEFGQNPIDIVLMDVNLGKESGWDTFKKLKNIRPKLPIIMMTGHDNDQRFPSPDVAEALMEKPLDMTFLLNKLDELSPRPA